MKILVCLMILFVLLPFFNKYLPKWFCYKMVGIYNQMK